jgi:hypothetical protein
MWRYIYMPVHTNVSMSHEIMDETHRNKKFASEEAIPWLIRVILLVLIEQQRPLITRNPNVAIGKLLAHAKTNLVSHVDWKRETKNSLCIRIVETSRAKKRSCYRMVEAPIRLDISTEGLRWRIHRQKIPHIPIPREYPVQNCPL